MKGDKYRQIFYGGIAIWVLLILGTLIYIQLAGVGKSNEHRSQIPAFDSPEQQAATTGSTDANVKNSAAQDDLVGQKIPYFSVAKYGGGAITPKDLKGKPAVIEFFASWCPHCRRMAPILDRTVGKRKGINYLMVSSAREKRPVVAKWYKSFLGRPMKASLGFDDHLDAARHFGVKAYPTLVFVDSRGMIQYITTGEMTASKINSNLNSIAAKTTKH